MCVFFGGNKWKLRWNLLWFTRKKAIKREACTLVSEYFVYIVVDKMFLCSDQRESHIVTKKFEVKQLETNDDDNVDFSRTVSVSEVR